MNEEEITQMWLEEAEERISEINEALRRAETGEERAIHSLLRGFHLFKGNASTARCALEESESRRSALLLLLEATQLSHDAERCVMIARDESEGLTPEALDFMREAANRLAHIVRSVRETRNRIEDADAAISARELTRRDVLVSPPAPVLHSFIAGPASAGASSFILASIAQSIANDPSVGYKASKTDFEDLFYGQTPEEAPPRPKRKVRV